MRKIHCVKLLETDIGEAGEPDLLILTGDEEAFVAAELRWKAAK